MQAPTMSTSHTRRPMPELSTEQAPYCLLPRTMLSDLRDNPLAIGLYLLVARLYLVSQAPIPLSRADVLAYDPTLKIGAVKRAFDRLTGSGWLIASSVAGSPKRHSMPSWGMVGGAVRPWSLQAPALGRPRHVETVRVNRDLLDVGMGRMSPHPRHAAEIMRYLRVPALSLADLGAYALTLAGLCHDTPTLNALGLVEHRQVRAVPSASTLLQQFVQHAGVELNEHGRRKLGVREQEQPAVIGRQIGGVIGDLIGSAPERNRPFSASERSEQPHHTPRSTIPGILRDSSDSPTPPLTPPAAGGQSSLHQYRKGLPPVPDTEASRLLRTIAVRPTQQRELAGMSLTVVEAAIADGRARDGIRDLAGWVVYLLRQHRDHGWTPPPPAPRADAPEVLGTYFAQLAAEQDAGQGVEQAQADSKADTHAAADAQLPSLTQIWQDVLATLRLRLPREVYQACVRQTSLMSYTEGVVTIGVSESRTKDTLSFGFSGALRLALLDVLGRKVAVRVVPRLLT